MEEIELRKNIYPTTWLPTLVKFIPRDYLFFSLFTSCGLMLLGIIFGIIKSIFWLIPMLIGFYIYGALRAMEDPEFFTVYAVRFLKLSPTKGGYKGREYIP